MTRRGKILLSLCLLTVIGIVTLVFVFGWEPISKTLVSWYNLITDPEEIERLKKGWGPVGGPVVFIGLQILQVILAPFPGEASGFVGGYLFGVVPGLIYSTIGLTIGSVINFMLGRVLGRRYVTKWVAPGTLARFDTMAKRQGTILFFSFFVFPGFPKDYLCIFLGLTSLPLRVLVLIAGIGRIPGTLMLSLQGAQVFQRDYATLAVLVAITLAFLIPAYVWRHRVYSWVDRLNSDGNSAVEK